eukprot:2270524-Rhodomonas_salina.1
MCLRALEPARLGAPGTASTGPTPAYLASAPHPYAPTPSAHPYGPTPSARQVRQWHRGWRAGAEAREALRGEEGRGGER